MNSYIHSKKNPTYNLPHPSKVYRNSKISSNLIFETESASKVTNAPIVSPVLRDYKKSVSEV